MRSGVLMVWGALLTRVRGGVLPPNSPSLSRAAPLGPQHVAENELGSHTGPEAVGTPHGQSKPLQHVLVTWGLGLTLGSK